MISFFYNRIINIYVILSNFLNFLKFNKKDNKLIHLCDNYDFSTTTKNIFWDNLRILKILKHNNIDGHFVECGVWKGITLVFFQKYIEIYNLKNIKIYGFDTFQGVPEPTKEDIDIYGNSMKKRYDSEKIDDKISNWNLSSIDEVKLNYFDNTVDNENLILIKGRVEDTLLNSNNIPKKIALLKLDTSLYEGTKIELEILFPKVQKGGIIIIEGYLKFNGVKKAVDNFFLDKDYLIKKYPITSRAIIYL